MNGNASKTLAKCKQNRKQSGSKPEAACPYFNSAIGITLICAEGIPIKGTQIKQSFSTKVERETYMYRYCCSEYRSCTLFCSAICTYNDGVECHLKDQCASCGWNPEVSRWRLLKWQEERHSLHEKQRV